MATRIDAPVSLESGDRMSRAEFHRRYSLRPDIKKAELVEGVVYVSSPVRFDRHAEPSGFVVVWLGTYAAQTPGVRFGDNGTVFLDDGNEVQPDAVLWRTIDLADPIGLPRSRTRERMSAKPIVAPRSGAEGAGRSARSGGPHLTDGGYLEGPPQLVVEVAASSVSYDLHDKKEAYRRNGVREYIVWRVLDRAIDWLRLTDGAYVPLTPDADGVIESIEFPGLRLDIPRMLAGDLAAVLGRLRPA